MESRDIASPSHNTNFCPRLTWVGDLIMIIAFKSQKKINPLILFPTLIRSSPSSMDQLHILDLVLGPLGSIRSRNFVAPIPEGLHRSLWSIRILRSRKPLVKAYPSNLGLRILLIVPRDPITLILKHASYPIEPLFWMGLRNHSLSTHESILPSDSPNTKSPRIDESL